MNQMQRRFGKLRTRSADESQVSVLLNDYNEADKMLTKIIDASKAWRDGWVSILGYQYKLVNEFEGLYNPIIGAGESHDGPEYAVTPRTTLARTDKLREIYEELRTDLLDEVNLIDARVIKPAMEAKESIQPLKKVIKKREDKKLDYEKYQNRVDTAKKKLKRSDKDNIALAKAEENLTITTEEYHDADDHIRATLPGVIAAAFSLLPHLLSAQILIQNTLLAQNYTQLHQYCQDEQFPSPAPDIEEVIAAWDADFKPLQRELETGIGCIASGKAVKHPMKADDFSQGGRNGAMSRRVSGQPLLKAAPSSIPGNSPKMNATDAPSPPDLGSKPKASSSPSQSLMALLTPPAESNQTSPAENYTPGTGGAFSPAAPRSDYFARDRVPSSSSISSAAAAKKKPPPPPPKRSASTGLWVIALYSFDGQGEGDLAFREGDKIRVVRKTESTDDWWEGELRGMKGSFPANYVRVN
ncbi:MAG: hypothetical protein M1837_004569 [Sclerophora amabilis]|nr:MAG: hypothetical protein M1837_004569 [Sclerophora amabilis]